MKKQFFILILLLLTSFKSFALDNYYKMLGVPENATADDIKKGYRKMAMKYHPDRNSGSVVAGEIFKKVQGAYEVLSDPNKRAIFDRQLKMQPRPAPKAAAASEAPKAKEAPAAKPSNAQKHTWENFDQKTEPKPEAKPEAKAEPKAQAEVKPEPKVEPKAEAKVEVKPTPEASSTDLKTASKAEAPAVNPSPEKAPPRNPKLDLYNSGPSCSKGFLGTVIDTLI